MVRRRKEGFTCNESDQVGREGQKLRRMEADSGGSQSPLRAVELDGKVRPRCAGGPMGQAPPPPPNVKSSKINCWFFLTGFRSSDRRQYSGSLLRDMGITLVIIIGGGYLRH
jgi:hypothetical protein